MGDFHFDLAAAERVRTFFRRFLRHSKGRFADEPFDLLDWQWEGIVKPLYGWRRADGTRRYRQAYIEVAKKNGKSTLCSGLSLYHLIGDREPGAEVYSAAASRDQASIVFNEAVNMVKASPGLAAHLNPVPSGKRIYYEAGRAVYQALSADVPTKEGLNASAVIFDELHAQRTRRLYDALRYAGAAREQPLMVMITTAGWDRRTICWDMHQRALRVLAGLEEDDAFFAYVAAAGEADDWKAEATWRRANPSLGCTVSLDGFASDCREAQASPLQENAFKRYRLNLWTEQHTRWLSMDAWDGCPALATRESLRGGECWGGLDMSSTTDLSSLALWFPARRSALWWFWAPEDCLAARAKRQKAALEPWVRAGWVKLTPGNVVDYDFVREDVKRVAGEYDLQELGVDRWNTTQLQTQLAGDGISVVQFGQGFASMTAPSKELERLVLKRALDHGGNPVARWMASLVAAEMSPSGDIKPSKRWSADRVDGVVALIMALGRAAVAEEDRFDGRLMLL